MSSMNNNNNTGVSTPSSSSSPHLLPTDISLPSSSSPVPLSSPVFPAPSPVLSPTLRPLTYGVFPNVGRHPNSLVEPIHEYCISRAGMNSVIGGCMGLFFGIFAISMGTGVNSYALSPGMPGWVDTTNMSVKEQFKRTGQEMWRTSKGSAKNFAFIGGVYTLVECNVEKKRGTHDIYNPMIAGCITGGAMGAKGGPQAAAFGCAGFAAFGLVIDKLMGHM